MFSFFPHPIRSVIPSKNISLDECAALIRDPEHYADITASLRAFTTREERQQLKASGLDFVTFSGTFSRREEKALIQYSGFIAIDLDHLEDLPHARYLLTCDHDMLPAMIFTSPSGDGLKVIYKVGIGEASHGEYFSAILTYLESNYDLHADPSGRDVCRACFLCHDPNVLLPAGPVTLDRSFVDTFNVRVSIPVSAPEPLTDHQAIIANIRTWLDKKLDFTPGQRNRYLSSFSAAMNRYGIPEQTALNELLTFTCDDFPPGTITAINRSCYRHTEWHNTASFDDNSGLVLTDIDQQEVAELRRSEVAELSEARWLSLPVSDSKTGKVEAPSEVEALTHSPAHPLSPSPALPIPPLALSSVEAFPISHLPAFIRDWITIHAETYGTPLDFWAASVIMATATAIGKTHFLTGRYTNNPLLWFVLVAPSGVGKTEPQRKAFAPFHERDKQLIDQYNRDMEEFSRNQSLPRDERDTSMRKPVRTWTVLSDTTPEEVMQSLNGSDRLFIHREELMGWFYDFGRYSKSGEQQSYLSIFSQSEVTVTRKSQPPLKILHPFLNVMGSIQTGLISEMAKDGRDISGMMQRFAFVFPDNCDRPYYNERMVPQNITDAYSVYINSLLSLKTHEGKGSPVNLSPESEMIFSAWADKNTDIINALPVTSYERGAFAKLEIICLRLALTIHFMKWAASAVEESAVTPDTLQSAIDITEYFRQTARKVGGMLKGNQQPDVTLKNIIQFLASSGKKQHEIAAYLSVSRQYVSKILNQNQKA
jgi:hypothetical protein